ncbi:MAG: response regulator [Spirochaetaceae bacterium]|nr:response regulator [Spirochaetaceae bacterium]
MWKVLIADDEPKIRRGLRALLASRADLEVVAEAEDGEIALEAAIEYEPDILLIDVRMPFRNGLELIESLRKALPGRIVIIVSGHDEFEYAQSAVKLGVFDYVLKPVDAELFAKVIARAVAELESRRAAREYADWSRSQLERNLPLLRERFLRDLVLGSLSRSEIDDGLAFLRIDFHAPMTVLAARFPERLGAGSTQLQATGGDAPRKLAIVALRAIVEEAFSLLEVYVFEDDTETILALMPGRDDSGIAAAIETIERRTSEQVCQIPALATRVVPRVGDDAGDGLCDAYDELRSELADGDGSEAFVVLARNYVDKAYWDPDLCLEEVAGEIQISPSYLSRLMKRETGFSFVEYMNRIRIRKATLLMSDPSAKAFEVAERVGYRSQHYFCRAFKKVTGTSPTDHRKVALQ